MNNNIYIKYNFILFTFSIFASCVSVRVDTLKEYPPKSRDCHLDVYTVAEEIGKPYEEICVLESKTGTNLFSKKTYKQAIELAKPQACECGADAIIVFSVDKQGVNLMKWGQGKAVVKGIRYKQ